MKESLKEKAQQGKKNISLIIIGGLVVIIALLVVVIVMFARRTAKASDAQAEETRRNVVVTQDTAESVVDDMLQNNHYVEPGYYSVSMNTTWHFKVFQLGSNWYPEYLKGKTAYVTLTSTEGDPIKSASVTFPAD